MGRNEKMRLIKAILGLTAFSSAVIISRNSPVIETDDLESMEHDSLGGDKTRVRREADDLELDEYNHIFFHKLFYFKRDWYRSVRACWKHFCDKYKHKKYKKTPRGRYKFPKCKDYWKVHCPDRVKKYKRDMKKDKEKAKKKKEKQRAKEEKKSKNSKKSKKKSSGKSSGGGGWFGGGGDDSRGEKRSMSKNWFTKGLGDLGRRATGQVEGIDY